MQLDLKKYYINRPFIQSQYHRTKGRYTIEQILSMASSTTHCPLLALAFYLAEDIGFIPEIIKLIDRLISFYGYLEILNQKEGSPYIEKFGEMI